MASSNPQKTQVCTLRKNDGVSKSGISENEGDREIVRKEELIHIIKA